MLPGRMEYVPHELVVYDVSFFPGTISMDCGGNLQSAPNDFHAASTSGPASCRKAFGFSKEPLKRTRLYVISTSFMIGANKRQRMFTSSYRRHCLLTVL